MEALGKGRINITPSSNVEFMAAQLDRSAVEVDGERASIKTKHPLFSDPAARQAINLLIDRASIEKFIYGRSGAGHRELPQQPAALPVEEHQVRIQHREGQPDPRGLPAGKRAATAFAPRTASRCKFVFQTFDQCAPAEDPGHRQAGVPEGGHRRRAEVGGGIGVLLLRCRQSRHLPAFLLRRADVPTPPCRRPIRSSS